MVRQALWFRSDCMAISEEQLIKQHLPLVRRAALQLIARLPANVQLDDLMQAGMMGLLDAVRRYQQMEQAQFETYAQTRVRGAMLDELRAQDWLPRAVRGKARQIETALQQLNHQLLRAPTDTEIADALELEVGQYHALLDEAHGVQVLHYEDLRGGQDMGSALDLPAQGGGATPLSQLFIKRLREALIQAIDELPERERLLLSLQFEHDLNQKEISLAMGVSEGRVSQLRSQAIARIRATLGENDWTQNTDEDILEKLI